MNSHKNICPRSFDSRLAVNKFPLHKYMNFFYFLYLSSEKIRINCGEINYYFHNYLRGQKKSTSQFL